MKRIVLFVLMVALGMASAKANPVDVQKARRIAAHYLEFNGAPNVELTDITSSMPYREFYTFVGSDGRGFVLVSGDDCVVPILGYSTTETFSVKGMPSNIRGWLEDCEAQIRFYKNLPADRITTDHSAEEAALRNMWDRLDGGMSLELPLLTSVSPLLSTRWNQSPYYNNLCPYDSYYAERTVTGCVATATAQIMKYWNHPTTGYGSHSYTHSSYGTQSANFGTTTYAWSSMPDSLISSSTLTQKTAVATLMYHVGVAVEMDYNVSSEGGSAANNYNETPGSIAYYGSATVSCAENALRYYFKYKSSMHHVNYEDFTQAQWVTMLCNELDNNRPVLYSGRDNSGGHSFVCDGYNNSGLFHFNWGWGGYCDGYYAIGSLNPASGGTGGNSTYTFNLSNAMVIGIQPNTSFGGSTTVSATAATGGTGTGTVTGGGSYTGTNTSLVTLSATAATGSAFTGWTDGFKYNPRTLYANGGTYAFQAQFKALSGDTLGYCSTRNLGAYQGYSNPTVWGIRIPAANLTAGHDLTKVMMYINTAGSYTLNVYTGTTSASTLAYTQSFTAPTSLEGQWCILTLSSPVAVSGTQSLWIMLQSSVDYPAAVTYYAGNDDSRVWGSTSGTFANDFSFMLKGVFAASSSPTTYGDTVSYCDTASFQTSVGAGGNLDWGIKLPPSMVSHRNYVTDVMLYVSYAGTYTLNMYSGTSTTSSTLAATQSVTFGSSAVGNWQTIHLTSPVATSTTQPLWITFHNSGVSYPAAACAYVGDSNSSYVSLDGGSSWTSLNAASGGSLSYSWLIKAILANTSTPTISINGPTTVGAGVPAHFAAVGPTSATYSWSFAGATPSTATGSTATTTWNTAGTYNVILTASIGGTLLRDTLAVTVTACNTVTTFPFTMGFEATESLSCWNNVDNDNDGYSWMHASQAFTGNLAHGGSDCFASASYINGIGDLTPDNWLVTPCLHLTTGNSYTLTWYDGAVDSTYCAEHYSVYVSTTGNSVSNFTSTPVFTTTLTTRNYTQRTVSLNAYAGQDIYIAFRHHNSNDIYWLLLDDISVTETTATTNYTITVISDNPTMGTVSGSGTFPSGTTTTISATANSGYHFVHWNDANTNAVRSITVTGNATYTAYFAANTTPGSYGDTVSYCDTASVLTSVGAGGSLDWGIKMPPSMVSHRNYVTDVMLYVTSAGSYTLNMYQGASTTSSTLAATQTVTFGSSAENSWQTIHLASPVATSTTQPLWVTFHNSGVTYPAAACTYMGDSNSSYVSLDGGSSWYSLNVASGGSLSYSWMIKVILANTATPTISINGPTTVGAGVAAHYAAVGPVSATYSWSFAGATPSTATGSTATTTWNTAGTYNVILTASMGGTLLRDTLAVTVTACGVTSFPFTMGFEASESLSCWNNVDNDNDGYSWMHASQAFSGTLSHSGSDCYASASYINGVGDLTPDNWLVTPCLHLTAGNNYTLTWYDAGVDSSYYAEHYSVYVSTTGNSVSNFTSTPIFTTTLTTVAYTQRTVSLNAYAGQDIYIAFRHHNSNDVYWLLLDDISVTEAAATNYTITVISDNPTMGTVSGSGTFPSGTVTTISATANSGYHFVQWNDGNTNSVRSITVTADATYTAYFAANPPDTYTITVVPNDPAMGSVTGSGTFASGTVTTITATANSGYHFVQWNDGNTDAIRTITVTADATYTAYFAADEVQYYTITVLSADNSMGSVEGGGTFPQGTTTVISAIPYAGYQFSHWNDAVHDNPRTITVTADATYVANFVAVQGIDDSQTATFEAVPLPGFVVALSGVENMTVSIYDIMGRQLFSQRCEQERRTVQLPAAGVYMIVVDNLPAQRIVLAQ